VTPDLNVPARVALSEVAEQLGVHYMTAYRYVRTGRLPAALHGARWTVAVEDLESFSLPTRTPGHARTTLERRTRLRERMIGGDEAGAWSVIEEAMSSGSDPSFIYTQLLMPSLRIIGEEWDAGRQSIAEEHRASEIASQLIGRLSRRFMRPGPSRGAIVLGMVAGEQHGLAASVLSDFLRTAGFEPINLGANTPSASFVEMALAADRLLAVMVGATKLRSDIALREVLKALRDAELTAPLLVGGRAVRDDAHAHSLGADAWSGHSSDDAVARLNVLLRSRTTSISQHIEVPA
jgi:excisionase family DNA binding protein